MRNAWVDLVGSENRSLLSTDLEAKNFFSVINRRCSKVPIHCSLVYVVVDFWGIWCFWSVRSLAKLNIS